MKCQKKPVEKKSILTSSYSTKICRPEYNCSSESSFFRYSIIKTYLINYEHGSKPATTAITLSAFSWLPVETDLTMKDPESYFEYAEKCFRSKAFSNPELAV